METLTDWACIADACWSQHVRVALPAEPPAGSHACHECGHAMHEIDDAWDDEVDDDEIGDGAAPRRGHQAPEATMPAPDHDFYALCRGCQTFTPSSHWDPWRCPCGGDVIPLLPITEHGLTGLADAMPGSDLIDLANMARLIGLARAGAADEDPAWVALGQVLKQGLGAAVEGAERAARLQTFHKALRRDDAR